MAPDRIPAVLLAVVLGALAGGCRQDMHDQPYVEPLESSAFFPDGVSARPEVAGTVPRGSMAVTDGALVAEGETDTIPIEVDVDIELVERGRTEYRVYCAPCHGESGYGNGTVVRRGFPAPPSFHTEAMRAKPARHYVEVITNGYGEMYDYASGLRPRDRWAVAAFIQALQLSQHASALDVSGDELELIEDRERERERGREP